MQNSNVTTDLAARSNDDLALGYESPAGQVLADSVGFPEVACDRVDSESEEVLFQIRRGFWDRHIDTDLMSKTRSRRRVRNGIWLIVRNGRGLCLWSVLWL